MSAQFEKEKTNILRTSAKKKKKKKLENIQINQPEMRDAKRLGESVTYLDPEGMSLGGSITVQSVCVSD